MDYNSGFIFLAVVISLPTMFIWVFLGCAVSENTRHERWLLLPTVLTIAAITCGYLAVIGVGK